ncbi:Glycosyltransferase involved in cell wall bisynthesis [Candidatus Kryptonium thompsonii]|mgnify:CR=1 FL=1|jgi:glycosyltransferase involved in cell wall biosynthesis|uniref:Glycosyltransferase involved in cell wall bisynthesis n=1 Tax=Candidatus Kryptonium thompsonii TaxID=1633631 RepID=A0A0P1LLZ4_9BACT|nr:glycosyltransferase family 4 protein [Candidatus Kryptonium thompsoni]CUS82498.1 Glycosyltransferase involved in cell wall bisynthesis [Candidatus Kryptonium thompsoni]CUS82808.1 Glycosyltransferase involved in cell wall bisynthesis [Candidatus Kryptonium thompsoni]CUS85724.1 Glycosyltransferase involved in cell wall bisynthesis [Candidatus Kryptonium thompsoni]CUS87274.1 Glycosyltransferase involved in cell wall bisynthesis [Candidatus Kryptonium thompsoni]CUS87302.1 Glycosyltransferase in
MNPKLELLYVISRLSWGGLEMNILRLANEMIKRGHSVTIACNLKGRLFQELVKIFNGEKRKIETVGLSSNFAENLATLLKILKQKQFSIIHIFNSSDLKLVSLAVILQAGNQALILDPQIGVGVSKKDLLHKIFYKKVDTVIAISKDVANGFLQNLPIDENKLKLIYPGVDVGKFRFSEQSRKKIRDEFNLEDEVVIGVISRFSPGKGHEELFKAFKILKDEFNNVKLLVVGEPTVGEVSYFKGLQKLAEELGINDKTIWTGFRKDVQDVLCAIDIFVAPSHAEAFGLSLVEAMATELPVVATRSAGFLDIISDGIDGLFFEKGNYEDLAEKIKLLIKNKELAKQLGKRARETVCEKFSFERYLNEIEALYLDLVKSKQTEVRDVQHSKP